MDLPPPPPFYPPPDHHHRFIHHPPPPPPPHVLFQPHRFAFSPPHEFDLPPPPPPQIINRDYFREEVYFRDNHHHHHHQYNNTALFDFDMRQQRFNDSLYRDDVIDRRFDNGYVNDRREIGRRWDLYDVNNNRQGDFGVSRDRVREFYRERVDYERRRVDERVDRFSGRLGRRVCDDEEVVRDVKKRKNTRGVDRIDVVGNGAGFNSNKRRKGSNRCKNGLKEVNCRGFRGGKGKEVGKRVETRKEDRKERENSPLELAISFESNGLVARTILTPPSDKEKIDSTSSKGSGKVNSSLLSKVDVLSCQFDAESDGSGGLELNVLESGKLMTTGNAIGEDVMPNGDLEELKEDGANIVGETEAISPEEHLAPSGVSEIGTTDVTSDVGVTAPINDSLGGIKSQRINRVGYWPARTRRLMNIMKAKMKRLRVSNLGATNGSSKIVIDGSGSPPGTSDQEANAKDADFECYPGKDEVASCANEAILDGGNTVDGSELTKHPDNANICVSNSDNTTVREDKVIHCPFQDSVYPSNSHETVIFSVSEANCSVLEKVEGEGCARVVVADCSGANLDVLTDSTLMSVEHKGIGSELKNSVLDTMIEQSHEGKVDLSHKNSPVEKYMEATEASPDNSPESSRKRKASYDQIDHKPSSVRVDPTCEQNRCEENESSSKESSEDGSSYKNIDVGVGIDDLSCKKKKVDSSGLTSMSIDGFLRDQTDFAARWKDAHTDLTTAIARCDASDIDIKVKEDNSYIADMGNISSLEEKEKLHVNGDELEFFDNNSKNVGSSAYSDYEQAEYDSDDLSCPSSPEDLLLFSDFNSPINTNVSPSLSRNNINYATGRTFRRSVSAEHLGNATSSYSGHTNVAIPSPITFPMVQKSKFTHGKLMSKNLPSCSTSKAFIGYPQKCSTAKTLPSTQVSKSKTWRRTGSVAETTPKLKPSLPPQVNTTKMSSPSQNSYVRKANSYSLTRTPSPSSAPSPGFNASSSLVYRASPSIDGFKKCQSFKPTVEASSLPRKPSPSSAISPGFLTSSSMVYRAPSVDGMKKSQAFKPTVEAPSLPRKPSPSSAISPGFHTSSSMVYRAPIVDDLKKSLAFKPTVEAPSLPRKPSPSSAISPGFHTSSSMVYRAPIVDDLKKNQAFKPTVEAPSLPRKPSSSSVISPGFRTSSSMVYRAPSVDGLKKSQAFKPTIDPPSLQRKASSSMVYRASPSTDALKNSQAIVDTPSLPRKSSPSSSISPGFHPSSSSVYRASPSIGGLSKGQAFKTIVDTPCPQRKPSPANAISSGFHTVSPTVYRLSPSTNSLKKAQASQNEVDGDAMSILQRKYSPSSVSSSGSNALRSSVYRLSPSSDGLKKGQSSNPSPLVNTSARTESLSLGHGGKSPNSTTWNSGESSLATLDSLYEAMKSCAVPESQNSQSLLDIGKSEKKITYVKRKSNQLVAASDSEDTSTSAVDKTRPTLSGGYFKSKKNQLVRSSLENQSTLRDANFKFGSYPLGSSRKRQLGKGKGFQKTFRSSKLSLVWKLHEDALSSEKHKVSERPQKVLSRLFPWKRATYRRSFMLALGSKPNSKPFSTSQKMLLSRKRRAVYTRSSQYSLKMSQVLSVGGSNLKWSKSLEKNSKKVNEDATRAVAATEKMKKEENITGAISSKTRSRVSRKLVSNVKPRPGERIFRIGSERYKMDPTRRTLRRITAEPSAPLPPEKNIQISCVPRRLYIGSNEYVRIGNGNQLVRDPKKRTRVLASEKVRWSLRTARLSWAKKKKYCQFFTKFGKCNKEDGKCPFIHDPTKIVVCTKFLNGSCSNPDCKLTHEVIPERMQDCFYFLKGSCSSDNCPYRHVTLDPDSPVCESFLRGYCPDGNECRKKHTYICPAFEATGICLQASTCKLHHPKKKSEKKPTTEETIVRGRYFDGGLVDLTNDSAEASERVFEKGKDDENEEGKFPDFISLDVSDDEMHQDSVKAS